MAGAGRGGSRPSNGGGGRKGGGVKKTQGIGLIIISSLGGSLIFKAGAVRVLRVGLLVDLTWQEPREGAKPCLTDNRIDAKGAPRRMNSPVLSQC